MNIWAKTGKTALATAMMFIIADFSAYAQTEKPKPEEKPKPTAEQAMTYKYRDNQKRDYWSFSFENDSIGGGTDSQYTNGLRLTYFNAGTQMPAPVGAFIDALPLFSYNDTTSTFYAIGQNMYTPGDITIRAPQPDDRPWAGFLYGMAGMTTISGNHQDQLDITLGVVGPAALAEPAQKMIHRHVTNSPMPKGWSNQLENEPALNIGWQRRWPFIWAYDFDSDLRLAATPNVNFAVGNVYTHAGTGVTFTFGPYQKTLQDLPQRVAPAMSGTSYFDVPDQNWSWYTFAGADARGVAHNIFLDGNSFEDSPSVDKKPLVGDAYVGAALSLYDYRLSYTLNYRTKEFDGQEDESVFGSLTLSTRF